MAHADQGDLLDSPIRAFGLMTLPSLVVEAGDQLVQVSACRNAVHRHDLDHAAVLLAIKD